MNRDELMGGLCAMALCPEAAQRFANAAPVTAQAGQGTAPDGVVIIPLHGFMSNRERRTFFGAMGGNTSRTRLRIQQAAADGNVQAILLHVDSPGGAVEGVTEAAAAIRAARKLKPVVALVDTVAASAAYWLASQADYVIATPSAQVGSVGVFIHHESYAGMDERLGIAHTFVKAGRYKTEGNMYEPLSDDAAKHMQELVDDFYGQFTGDVAQGRKVSAAVVRGESYGEGRLFTARQALERKMVDAIGTGADAMRWAMAKAKGGASAAADELPVIDASAGGEPEPSAPSEPVADLPAAKVPVRARLSKFAFS